MLVVRLIHPLIRRRSGAAITGQTGRLRRAGTAALAVSVTGILFATSAQAASGTQAPPANPRSYLWSWASGPLGIGTSGVRVQAQPIHGLGTGPVKQVTVNHNGPVVALLDNGTVWAWGNGPLGDGGTESSDSPVQLTSLSGITQVAATTSYEDAIGTYTIYALAGNGTVWAWGDGANGELGNGTDTATALSPVQVTGLTGVTSIVAGGDGAYALESNGTVWAWGDGTSGQLGDGTMANSDVPVQVHLTAPATQVTSTCGSAYALTSHHQVFAWGENNAGQLGDGTKADAAGPRLVRRVSDASTVVASCYSAYAIIQPAGTVMAWGAGSAGQIGDGHKANRPYAEAVSGLTGVASVSTAYRTAFAVLRSGTVWAWGFGRTGQLGNGQYNNSDVPVQVMSINAPVVSVVADGYAVQGLNDIYAVTSTGSVWSWGPIIGPFGVTGGGGQGADPGQMPRLPAATAVFNNGSAWFAAT
jgi:alpha-tubulin suppressor-like RCC1 family protein